MTDEEKQEKIEVQRLIDSPTTPEDLREQLKHHSVEEITKYYEKANMRQFEEADIFPETTKMINALIHVAKK